MAFKAISGLDADAQVILTPEPLVTAANIDDEDVQAVLKLTYPLPLERTNPNQYYRKMRPVELFTGCDNYENNRSMKC